MQSFIEYTTLQNILHDAIVASALANAQALDFNERAQGIIQAFQLSSSLNSCFIQDSLRRSLCANMDILKIGHKNLF